MTDNSLHFSISDADSTIEPFHYSSGTLGLSKLIKRTESEKSNENILDSQNLTKQDINKEQPKFTTIQSFNQNNDLNSQNDKRFTHVFICIHKIQIKKDYDSKIQPLFARIKINPKIPEIKTQETICIINNYEPKASYAIDISTIPEFDLNEAKPTIEIYRKVNKKSELIGKSLLPLKNTEKQIVNNKILTFFYRNTRVKLNGAPRKLCVGHIHLTLGTGFFEHISYFNPSFTNQNDIPVNLNSNNYNNNLANMNNYNDFKREEEEDEESHKRRHRHHHRRKRKNMNWQKYAMAYGWQPPTHVDKNWKDKAMRKGWIPPQSQIFSSIGVNCKKEDIVPRVTISTQYEPVILSDICTKDTHKLSDTGSTNTDNNSDDELDDLILLLNSKAQKKGQKKDSLLSLESPSTVFHRYFPMLTITPIYHLLDIENYPNDLIEDSDYSDLLDQNVHDLIQKTLNTSEKPKLANTSIPKISESNQRNDTGSNTDHQDKITPLPDSLVNLMEIHHILSESDSCDESSDYDLDESSSCSFNASSDCPIDNICKMYPDLKRLLDIAKK